MIRSSNPEPSASNLAAWLRLSLTHGVGPAAVISLLRVFGSADDVLGASHSRVSDVIGSALATRLLQPDNDVDDQVTAAIAWQQQAEHHVLTFADPDYPPRLLEIGDPPPTLYVIGKPSCLSAPSIAIVGSRHATRAGEQNAQAFAQALAERGFTIISGLARGIDAAAHRGALAAGNTIAFMGTGVDRVYPAVNRELARQITESGAVVSEFPLGTGASRGHFPRRNRLIAGLSQGTLVVEAAKQSGSLITARLAGDFGREVFAIPGSIHSPLSRGCHRLIRQGAKLVESAEDILTELGAWAQQTVDRPESNNLTGSTANRPEAAEERIDTTDDPLLYAMGWDPVSLDVLSTTLPNIEQIDRQLLELELSGHIERLVDGRFQRLN